MPNVARAVSFTRALTRHNVGRHFISLSLIFILGILVPISGLLGQFSISVEANNTVQTPTFSQDWTNIGLITTDDDWVGVPGIIGYRGDALTSATGINPQTVVAESTVVDVTANQLNPNTFTTGGVSEFHIANPVVALQGSGTARAPYIQLHLNTTGKSSINVAYNLRDVDGSADNAVQPVALQFRIGSTGNFTNVPAGFVADASSGPSLATLVTPVSATLPATADNQPLVQVRIITTDAAGSDEWIGVDDIVVTGSDVVLPTNPTGTGQADPNSIVAGGSTLLTVTVNPGANPTSTGLAVTVDLSSIDGSNAHTFFDNGTNGDVTIGDNVFSYNATTLVTTTPGAKSLPFNITDAEARSGSGSISLTIQAPPPPSDHVVISQIYGGGGNTSATYQNDYVELYNPSPTTFNLNGWSIQYAAATGSGWASGTVPLAGPIAPGEYYLVKLGSNGAVGATLPAANVEGSVNMSATAGKIALVNDSAGLTGTTATCPTDDVNLVDLVGYGSTANCHEGAANAPGPSSPTTNSTAILRNGNGATDTNQNGSDFALGTPNPRQTAIIVDSPPSVSSTDLDSDPFETTPGAPHDGSVAVFFSENVEVTGTWYDLTCANTGPHTTVVSAGPRNWIITPDVDFQPGETCTFQIFAANVKDSDTDDGQPNTDFMQANYSTNFTVATGAATPYDPSVHLTMGNPSGATADINQFNNYLLEKPEMAISYNRDRGGPNWVSWHLSNDWTGSLTRVDTFRPDPRLPVEWNRVNQFDYTGSGFDRGHMTPSADRLATLPINQSTFLMDNIIPQAPENNQQTWNNMEQALRTYTPANELYIVSGGAGIGGSGNNGFATTIAGGRITVPAYTWKVALVIPKGDNDISRVDCSARTIAVIVPNTNGTNPDWTAYLTTVNAVEELTGYDFFSNLPDAIENCVEAGTNGDNPPGTEDQSAVTPEDNAASITLNAVSPSPTPSFTYTIASGPTNGILSGTGANRTYTPNSDFYGTDSFTFYVNDGTHTSNTSTVHITVTEVNDNPVAATDSKNTNEDTQLSFPASDLNSNDNTGPANESSQSLTVTSVSQTVDTHGTVTLTTGTVNYSPDQNFNGAASFTYQVCDNGTTNSAPDSKCATGTVNVTVAAINDNPDAVDDTPTIAEDSGANTINVRGNDVDVDGDTLTVTAVTQGAHGSVAITNSGADVSYTPAANFFGTDSFTYTVSDGHGGSDTATVNITVTNVNDAPVLTSSVAMSLISSTNSNLFNVGLTASATDQEGETVTIHVDVFGDENDETPTLPGDVHSPDAKDIAPDTLRLRGERVEANNGRVYLIIVTATDTSGGVSRNYHTVVVPKNNKQANISLVYAEAAAAAAAAQSNGDGTPPPGYFVIGDGPVIGPKQ